MNIYINLSVTLVCYEIIEIGYYENKPVINVYNEYMLQK